MRTAGIDDIVDCMEAELAETRDNLDSGLKQWLVQGASFAV